MHIKKHTNYFETYNNFDMLQHLIYVSTLEGACQNFEMMDFTSINTRKTYTRAFKSAKNTRAGFKKIHCSAKKYCRISVAYTIGNCSEIFISNRQLFRSSRQKYGKLSGKSGK